MRLCLNDAGLVANRKLRLEDAKRIHDIGFRVAGVHIGGLEITDDDIEHVKDIFARTGLEMGPFGVGYAAIHPDREIEKEYKRNLVKALKIGGKLGCTNIRISAGSMDPNNIWIHHPENHTQKALDMLIESTKELVPVAEDSRCAICPETTQWTIVGSIARMEEYVDRLDSPYVQVTFDPVNHMTSERVYESGRFMKCAIGFLGDRIGEFHVKDVMVQDRLLVSHIDECPMGTGVLDHEAIIRASGQLESWKTFSLEHFSDKNLSKTDQRKRGYNHIQGIVNRIGHRWTDPKCSRERWEKMLPK
jgi:sugar phosphate isomerase/epimerase